MAKKLQMQKRAPAAVNKKLMLVTQDQVKALVEQAVEQARQQAYEQAFSALNTVNLIIEPLRELRDLIRKLTEVSVDLVSFPTAQRGEQLLAKLSAYPSGVPDGISPVSAWIDLLTRTAADAYRTFETRKESVVGAEFIDPDWRKWFDAELQNANAGLITAANAIGLALERFDQARQAGDDDTQSVQSFIDECRKWTPDAGAAAAVLAQTRVLVGCKPDPVTAFLRLRKAHYQRTLGDSWTKIGRAIRDELSQDTDAVSGADEVKAQALADLRSLSGRSLLDRIRDL